MKKFRLIFVAALAACVVSSVCFAEYGISDYPALHEKQAQFLFELGLFKGTDKGFELDRVASRGEIAVMLTRLLGAESEAIAQNNVSPFTDVPEWCAPHVGWLYKNGYTNGIGDNKYGTDMQTICDNYATFLSRIVYGATIEKPATIAGKTRFYPQLSQERWNSLLTRGDAVEVSVWALESQMGETPETLMQNLIRRNVVTEEKVLAVAPIIYLPDRLHSKLLPEHEVSSETGVTNNHFFQIGTMLYKSAENDKRIVVDTIPAPKSKVWIHLYSTPTADYFYKRIASSDDYEIVKYNSGTNETKTIYSKITDDKNFGLCTQFEVDGNALYWETNNEIFSLNFSNDIVNRFNPKDDIYSFNVLNGNVYFSNMDGDISKKDNGTDNAHIILSMSSRPELREKLNLYPYQVTAFNDSILKFTEILPLGSASGLKIAIVTEYEYNVSNDLLICTSCYIRECESRERNHILKDKNSQFSEERFEIDYQMTMQECAKQRLDSRVKVLKIMP